MTKINKICYKREFEKYSKINFVKKNNNNNSCCTQFWRILQNLHKNLTKSHQILLFLTNKSDINRYGFIGNKFVKISNDSPEKNIHIEEGGRKMFKFVRKFPNLRGF